MADHAILSPSGASRWLSCTPSARLEQQFPNVSSAAASEGTLAHALGELIIRYRTKKINRAAYNKALENIQASSQYEQAMFDYMDAYAVYVIEQYAMAQAHTLDAVLFLEQRLNLTDYVPEGFGTGDVVIIADGVLDIIDLKYGKGVPVYADNNKQMMLYSLGALREFDYMYAVHTVRMTIYQPRLDTISTWEISVADLKEWAENELKPKAQLAYNGEGEFNPGEACRFCRAKAVCKANAEYNLQMAKHDFKAPELLGDEDISEILTKADTFLSWIKAVSDHALAEAVNHGKKWPGFKLVEGRSNRTYTDREKIMQVLTTDAAHPVETITEPVSLLPITKLEKAIGKKDFEQYVSPYIIKPAGKPTLVPQSDKRPEYNSTDGAVTDFAEVLAEELM